MANARRRFQTNGQVADEVLRQVTAAIEKLFPTDIPTHLPDPDGDPMDPDYIKSRVQDTAGTIGKSVTGDDLDYWAGVIKAGGGWSDYWRIRVIMGDNYMKLTDEQIDGMKKRAAGIAYIAAQFALAKASANPPTSRHGSGNGAGDMTVTPVTDDDLYLFNAMYEELFPR